MNTFDVLQPTLDLHKRYFVEASAGCGKTFSIENIVARLVMDEEKPFDIEKILVLTFTKEATSELKARIRKCLELVKDQLESPSDQSFEYVRAFGEYDTEKKSKAIRKLQEALAKFDLAQIFTIHKFCFMKLKQFLFEAELNLSEDVAESNISLKTYERVVRDYLGFHFNSKMLSKEQLKLLLSFYKNDMDALLQAIVYQLVKEVPIRECKSIEQIRIECEKEVRLDDRDAEEIYTLYENAASLFKGGTNRLKELPKVLKASIQKFALFIAGGSFDVFIEEYPSFIKVFDKSNLKKSALKNIEDHSIFFNFHEKLSESLFPLLDEATQKENLLAGICSESQKLLNVYFEKNKILTPSNILTKFNDLIDQNEIAKTIRAGYQAVIVDEFQDTDPTQWQILSKIFLKNSSKHIPFYLVGDPKQSIYGFRRADIYTYLTAAKALGISDVSTLNVNYRSQPGLIDALNALFTKEKDKWLSLPRLSSFLTYKPVQSFDGIEKKDFKDAKGSIHFIVSEQKEKRAAVPSKQLEEKFLFPFFINEILRLHHELKMPFRSFAILVRDRFQGARLKAFLKKYRLPFMSTRPESMQGLSIIETFLQIYLATLHPKKSKYTLALKLNSILQLPKELFEESGSRILDHFMSLKEVLFEKGFFAFFQMLMCAPFLAKESIYERILSDEEGLYQYLELEQMKDLLLQEEVKGSDPHHLLKVLEDLSRSTALPEKVHPLRQNFEEDGLQILTLHMSKGLEFEVVFALGLVNQVRASDTLIFDTKNNELKASSLISKEDAIEYQEEQDAEKMRQLYVAMTRAKQRLYLPYVITTNDKSLLASSPIESFLQHIGLDFEGLKEFISGHKEMSYTFCEEEIEVKDYPKSNPTTLITPSVLKKSFPKENKHSFTSLASHHQVRLTDLKAPADFSNASKTIHTLPAGSHTGTLFHTILEKTGFSKNNLQIDAWLSKTPYEPWTEVIEQTVKQLLNTPIKTPSCTFTLNELKESQVLKEIEFLYPITGGEAVEDMHILGDYMQGFIDLVCLYNNKYYLIDYKTNWLGSQSSNYMDLELAMRKNQYFLQADIYKEALKKYISLFDKREFEECFGGTLYWFVRGLDASNGGIFFIAPK